MQQIPECLNRRYKALDELVKELNELGSTAPTDPVDDPSIKLLCDFWNILKEDPNINLSQAVQQRMCVNAENSSLFGSQQFNCYLAGFKKNDEKKKETVNRIKNVCCKPSNESRGAKSATPSTHSADLPLNKVLCNLKQAASFEKKCHAKVNDLLETQNQLQEQIQTLEQKEEAGIQLLKQADCMWSCMEGAYKKKIAESVERQKELLKQLKEVEESNKKWRKNKKDLDFEMDNVNKCHQEITERINQKTSDIQCIDIEIENFKKRIESNKKDLEATKKSFSTKKIVSDGKIANISKEVKRLEKVLQDELKYQKEKELEGGKYVKEAREDLQKLCKVLLQKKIENEDMRAEREALISEIDMLNQTCDQCKDKCKIKEQSIDDEIKSLDKEIAEFKLKCIRCHQCTDTVDVRKYCTDCPRCINERDCLYEGDQCSPDHSMDCVCTSVKQKFLDNIFDNMYTMLERQVKTGSGKAVAEAVLSCLKKSRNGKLNAETRQILQDFILSTVKKNLNLTIVGGAVKTRCEMDAETYQQLMLCLKQVKVVKPEKIDHATESMKEPCTRWGGRSECNCPKGPKECLCIKKAPPSLNEPTTCPPEVQEKQDTGETVACPYKENRACGPECGNREPTNSVTSELASWIPNPCQGPTCQFKNMRAAQCVLGPESLSSFNNSKMLQNQSSCMCGESSTASCVCKNDVKQLKVDYNTNCANGVCKKASKGEINKIKSLEMKQNEHKAKEKNITAVNKYSKRNINVAKIKINNEKEISSTESKHEHHEHLTKKRDLAKRSILHETISSGKVVGNKEHKSVLSITPDDLKLNKKLSKKSLKFNIEENDFSKCVKSIERVPIKSYQKDSKNSEKRNVCKVKVKGINNGNKESLFVLKRTDSGNFELVLDKEFRKHHKKIIKEYEGDDVVQYAKLIKTSSGQFILNFDEKCEPKSDCKNALIMKSDTGNIKVLVNKLNVDSLDLVSSKSVMSAQDVGKLLNAYSPYGLQEKKVEKLRSPQLLYIKSQSDSNLSAKKKLLINKEQKDKDFVCKSIATSCNSKHRDGSCDNSKCVCKNICYKSKRWSWTNSEEKKIIPKRCNINTEKQEQQEVFDNTSNVIQTTEKYMTNYKNSNKNVYDKNPLETKNKQNNLQLQWDSLDYLPPQLPSFLQKFEYL